MITRDSTGRKKRIWTIAAVLAAFVMLIPIGFTTAYLTDKVTASQTTGGTGRWCSVPSPEKHPNAYRLKDFTLHQWSSSESSRMIIVPVVRNGEFGPGGGDGRLGVRAWSCLSTSLSNNTSIKVTAWRNASSSSTFNWLPRVNGAGFASHRLNPESGFGNEIATLHRAGTKGLAGVRLGGADRQRYSWLMSSDRTKSKTDATPSYSLLVHNFNINPYPTLATGFNSDLAGSRQANNSVTYLASAYWRDEGIWTGSLLNPPTVQPVNLAPYGGPQAPFSNGSGPTSTDGRQVEWVIMEWWGSTTPENDMVLEVFVR